MRDDDAYERARELREAAGVDPATVDVEAVVDCLATEDERARHEAANAFTTVTEARSDCVPDAADRLTTLLESEEAGVRQGAARTVAQLADRHPDALERTAPALRAIVEREFDYARNTALLALADLGKSNPAVAAPLTESLREYVAEDYGLPTRERATRALAVAADARPDAVADAVPALVEHLGTDDAEDDATALPAELPSADEADDPALAASFREHAARTLAVVAGDDPEAVAPHAATLAALLDDEADGVRRAALDALAALAERRPDAVLGHRDALRETLTTDGNEGNRATAAYAMSALAEAAPGSVAETLDAVVPSLVELLDGEYPRTRGTAAGTLSYVGERDPSTVADAVPSLVELLDDETAFVRANAAYALGTTGVEEAHEALRACAEHDSDPEVRAAARDALELAPDG
ncbi:HEAT repeat domain-containing protein [Halomicrococcus sp. NG-SE-24]|uniref:HEAT repeat domain-containing protein n=1 Tax=Halomicrococcus sp. NG-SE-24 TaxID=3436928 RepID=UPI003D98733B